MAAASCSSSLAGHHMNYAATCSVVVFVLVAMAIPPTTAFGCFKSLISFGDSLTDTGNSVHLFPPNRPPNYALPPFGRTFFHHPTGRCSDGRLIVDFIAESLGLPLVLPYLEGNDLKRRDFGEGVNFAVVGATALNVSFLQEKGVYYGCTDVSLEIELLWFKEMLASSCQSSSDCNEFLRSSLILVGEIGANDYYNALMEGKSIEEIYTFVPEVVAAISSAINELIELGAVTLLVPGDLPIGCVPVFLTIFKASDSTEYDNFGCVERLNKLSKYHNELLQVQLAHLREIHPRAHIIYADYYNAAIPFFHSPDKFGFTATSVLNACCGAGGPYNYNLSVPCGEEPSTCCNDPSVYVSWDGLHMTEAANEWIARGILQGPYANPSLHTICNSKSQGINPGLFVS